MSEPQAEQPTLAGLAPRKRRKQVTHTPAEDNPIAQVVLDVQAIHLGQTFDYLIDEKQSRSAQPGVMVRVRFGGRRVNGIIWDRVKGSHAAPSALRYIERVKTPTVIVSATMRRDITAIADAYGGTPANILRLAVPPRVARVDQEQHLVMSGTWAGSRGRIIFDENQLELASQRLQASYDNALVLQRALNGGGFSSFVFDTLPGATRWADDLAYTACVSLHAGRAAVLVLPTMREVGDMASALQRFGLKPFRQMNSSQGGHDGDFVLLSAAMAPAERYRSYLALAAGQVRCVIGTRGAMYAPVEGPGLFAILEDAAYQNADGMMPYAAARGVLRLRAKLHGGTFMAMGNARTATSEWEVCGEKPKHDDGAADTDGKSEVSVGLMHDGQPFSLGQSQEEDESSNSADMPPDVAGSLSAMQYNAHETGDQIAAEGEERSVEPILETGETYPLDDRHNGRQTGGVTQEDPIFSTEPVVHVNVCQTPVSGSSKPMHPLPSVVNEVAPWVRWLNRDELARMADPTIGARVPHTAVRVLSEALEHGPILFSIPHDGIAEVLSCARCHRQARCSRCTGPLQQIRGAAPRCRWCGTPVGEWVCPECHGKRMSVVRVGAAGTAAQLQHMFRDIPIVLSSPSQPNGVVDWIPERPLIVIATPEAEPRVKTPDGAVGHYRAVAILDAWTSLYAPGVDARVDALTAWMRAASMCTCRSEGGQVLLIGETDPAIAESLVRWDSRILAARELDERAQTGLSPVFAVACVWGRREAVMTALRHIGVMDDGEWSRIRTDIGAVPAVLGPVPIAQPRTIDARELEATQDRVKAVVRVTQSLRAQLARRLHAEVARHVATRTPGELRFQLDPKDLI